MTRGAILAKLRCGWHPAEKRVVGEFHTGPSLQVLFPLTSNPVACPVYPERSEGSTAEGPLPPGRSPFPSGLPAVGRVGRRGLVLKASAQGLALKGRWAGQIDSLLGKSVNEPTKKPPLDPARDKRGAAQAE